MASGSPATSGILDGLLSGLINNKVIEQVRPPEVAAAEAAAAEADALSNAKAKFETTYSDFVAYARKHGDFVSNVCNIQGADEYCDHYFSASNVGSTEGSKIRQSEATVDDFNRAAASVSAQQKIMEESVKNLTAFLQKNDERVAEARDKEAAQKAVEAEKEAARVELARVAAEAARAAEATEAAKAAADVEAAAQKMEARRAAEAEAEAERIAAAAERAAAEAEAAEAARIAEAEAVQAAEAERAAKEAAEREAAEQTAEARQEAEEAAERAERERAEADEAEAERIAADERAAREAVEAERAAREAEAARKAAEAEAQAAKLESEAEANSELDQNLLERLDRPGQEARYENERLTREAASENAQIKLLDWTAKRRADRKKAAAKAAAEEAAHKKMREEIQKLAQESADWRASMDAEAAKRAPITREVEEIVRKSRAAEAERAAAREAEAAERAAAAAAAAQEQDSQLYEYRAGNVINWQRNNKLYQGTVVGSLPTRRLGEPAYQVSIGDDERDPPEMVKHSEILSGEKYLDVLWAREAEEIEQERDAFNSWFINKMKPVYESVITDVFAAIVPFVELLKEAKKKSAALSNETVDTANIELFNDVFLGWLRREKKMWSVLVPLLRSPDGSSFETVGFRLPDGRVIRLYNDKAIVRFHALLNRIERELHEQKGIISLSGDELRELGEKLDLKLSKFSGSKFEDDVANNSNMMWSTIRDLLDEKQKQSTPAATPAPAPEGNRTPPPSEPEPNGSDRQPPPGAARAGPGRPPSPPPSVIYPNPPAAPPAAASPPALRPARRRAAAPPTPIRSGFLVDPIIAHMEARIRGARAALVSLL